MILTVLFYILVASTTIQIIYLLCFSTILFTKDKKKAIQNIPVSVIICAKNEAKNLKKHLPFIINQQYNTFEILLINDASTDDTLEVMQQFKKQHNSIRIVNVENIEAFWGNKKYALTLGIKAATYEHLLFTDADCKPVSKHWIQEMMNCFSNAKSIVLGYGKYQYQNSLLNRLIRFETLLTAIQYFSYAKLGSPYMGVGRNLAYTKKEFFKTKGFINHIQVKSGDDDLFIQEAATNDNTTFTIRPESYTFSESPKTLKQLFRQKRRHISTSSHYKFKHQFFLSLYFISKVLLYSLTAIFLFVNWQFSIVLFALYILSLYVVIGFATKKFKEKNLLLYLPFLEIFLLLFQFTIFISNTFSKPTHWN
ncbi:MAG: glycosyltransferase [Flavobacteriaceae bacterium]|nr:glycosyltransferase [Flavobacteriaceae bacterium]